MSVNGIFIICHVSPGQLSSNQPAPGLIAPYSSSRTLHVICMQCLLLPRLLQWSCFCCCYSDLIQRLEIIVKFSISSLKGVRFCALAGSEVRRYASNCAGFFVYWTVFCHFQLHASPHSVSRTSTPHHIQPVCFPLSAGTGCYAPSTAGILLLWRIAPYASGMQALWQANLADDVVPVKSVICLSIDVVEVICICW